MIIREKYMTQIRPVYESDLIKIFTGIRRCGKSVILKQVLNELEAAGKRCLFLGFESRPVRNSLPDADALIACVKQPPAHSRDFSRELAGFYGQNN